MPDSDSSPATLRPAYVAKLIRTRGPWHNDQLKAYLHSHPDFDEVIFKLYSDGIIGIRNTGELYPKEV